ncbi:MAG: YbaK/EbsC family protein [Actinobacteria bacterium]|nr:YbaK/EbsC family protein [Actinomycetota bacterium]
MHPNAQKVQATLTSLGHDTEVVEFSESTRTSQEAAAAIGTSLAQIAKSMIFAMGDEGVMVVTSGANRVSTDKVGALLGGEIGRADADGVRKLTGFPIGGVPPVAHLEGMTVLIDEDLTKFDEVWAAAGTPNAVFRTTPAALAEMTGGRIADIKEEPK